jgi:hypothetical protein
LGINRLVVKWARPDLRKAREAILAVLENETDPRAKIKAAQLIADGAWRDYEHEHPPVQKSEITHLGLPVPPSVITYKISPDEK